MPRSLLGKFPFLFLLAFLTLSFPALAGADTPPKRQADRPLADRSLSVHSWEKNRLLGAEVDSRLDYPFFRLRDVLTRPEAWCEFLPLVFNIKSCTYGGGEDGQHLTVYVGRKFYETPDEAYQLDYLFRVREETADRLKIVLLAPEGPHGTGDYRIEVEARAEPGGRTLLHLQSSFRPSLRSQLATRAYLATAGRDKVGFSIKGYANGEPVYVGGTGGIVERNAMRYYLALKAYLDTLQLPPGERFRARLHAWYDMTANYHRQLYEMEKEEYLSAKEKERRQQRELQEALSCRAAAEKEASS